jgi:hypothetical protein
VPSLKSTKCSSVSVSFAIYGNKLRVDKIVVPLIIGEKILKLAVVQATSEIA